MNDDLHEARLEAIRRMQQEHHDQWGRRPLAIDSSGQSFPRIKDATPRFSMPRWVSVVGLAVVLTATGAVIYQRGALVRQLPSITQQIVSETGGTKLRRQCTGRQIVMVDDVPIRCVLIPEVDGSLREVRVYAYARLQDTEAGSYAAVAIQQSSGSLQLFEPEEAPPLLAP